MTQAASNDRPEGWMDAHWMPFTGNRQFKASPRLITGAEGAYYRTDDGRRIFDGLSGLWCTGLGHDASNIAAVIVEPFSGSAGVVIPPVGYLQRLREICTANNILLIFDEVITGFGRTGAWTGAEAFGVTPDILTAAKQITNGVQPLGVVVAKQEIHDTFMCRVSQARRRHPR